MKGKASRLVSCLPRPRLPPSPFYIVPLFRPAPRLVSASRPFHAPCLLLSSRSSSRLIRLVVIVSSLPTWRLIAILPASLVRTYPRLAYSALLAYHVPRERTMRENRLRWERDKARDKRDRNARTRQKAAERNAIQGKRNKTERAMSRAERCLYSAFASRVFRLAPRLVSASRVFRLGIPHAPCLLISSRYHHLVSLLVSAFSSRSSSRLLVPRLVVLPALPFIMPRQANQDHQERHGKTRHGIR